MKTSVQNSDCCEKKPKSTWLKCDCICVSTEKPGWAAMGEPSGVAVGGRGLLFLGLPSSLCSFPLTPQVCCPNSHHNDVRLLGGGTGTGREGRVASRLDFDRQATYPLCFHGIGQSSHVAIPGFTRVWESLGDCARCGRPVLTGQLASLGRGGCCLFS